MNANLTTDAQLDITIPQLLVYSRGVADFILEDQHDVSRDVNRFLNRELSMPEGCALNDNLVERLKWLYSMYINGFGGIFIDDEWWG